VYLVHGRFLAALDLLERRLLGSVTTYGNPEGRCVRRCAPRRMGGSLPQLSSATHSRNNSAKTVLSQKRYGLANQAPLVHCVSMHRVWSFFAAT